MRRQKIFSFCAICCERLNRNNANHILYCVCEIDIQSERGVMIIQLLFSQLWPPLNCPSYCNITFIQCTLSYSCTAHFIGQKMRMRSSDELMALLFISNKSVSKADIPFLTLSHCQVFHQCLTFIDLRFGAFIT